ncbi:hypothetical protein LTR09_012573 [Extremus antarcticus]|uniref:Uncharacterized protein n=1 Tax=Extremus antarcticus TaxID=702011 RepID=A0AAJ0D525_9PEZI|nr:hypothetical protein LTR09_012573 [Extremus antarcticus]
MCYSGQTTQTNHQDDDREANKYGAQEAEEVGGALSKNRGVTQRVDALECFTRPSHYEDEQEPWRPQRLNALGCFTRWYGIPTTTPCALSLKHSDRSTRLRSSRIVIPAAVVGFGFVRFVDKAATGAAVELNVIHRDYSGGGGGYQQGRGYGPDEAHLSYYDGRRHLFSTKPISPRRSLPLPVKACALMCAHMDQICHVY